jgi:2,3-diaminopropionate biosynthesis protein SbnB
MLILGNEQVGDTLEGREHQVLQLMRRCYLRHARGDTTIPHSAFLELPTTDRDRIIGLPAYLGDIQPVAGIQWISSFPGNPATGIEGASAAIILNSVYTGQPEALIEGSIVSAWRTAASAALAATTLAAPGAERGASLIGCGAVNLEVLRFLRVALPGLDRVTLFDLDRERAISLADRCLLSHPRVRITIADRVEDALAEHRLVSLATTATVPHLDIEHCRPGTLLLHLSLRDLTPPAVLNALNVVDDADDVCRGSTSLHLAERLVGHRDFIVGPIGRILAAGPYRRDADRVTVFSPAGLGMLDIALAELVRGAARAHGLGTHIPDFLPCPPTTRDRELAYEH